MALLSMLSSPHGAVLAVLALAAAALLLHAFRGADDVDCRRPGHGPLGALLLFLFLVGCVLGITVKPGSYSSVPAEFILEPVALPSPVMLADGNVVSNVDA